jgi:predicted TIM-barrel fold metal-dependent hydrolase
MRIDAHAHVVSQAYLDAIPAPPGVGKPPAASLEALQTMMERYAIDAAVISVGPPAPFFGDQGAANELARMANEELAAYSRAQPERFAPLAVLPLPDVDAAVAELTYALDVLEMDGVIMMTNAGGAYLGDPDWEPLYAELERRAAYVFVHPTMPTTGQPLGHPVWLYEFPFDTTRAIANLIYGGTLERHASIRWQLAHCGGTAPFLAERIASLADREPALAELAPAGTLEYLSRLYYDTGLANNEIAYRTTRLVAPQERIVFGSDWPYLALPAQGGDPAPGLSFLDPVERDALDAANVGALVPRLAEACSSAAEKV